MVDIWIDMVKKVHTTAINFLKNLTGLGFFGWVDNEYHVDAVAYIHKDDLHTLGSLMLLPEHIRGQMNISYHSDCLRVCLPKINSTEMVKNLSEFAQSVSMQLKNKPDSLERRALRIATISMPTGGFSKISPRTIDDQTNLFYQHTSTAYEMLLKDGKLNSDEMVICVLPEFYSHCNYKETNNLFMPFDAQEELLNNYCFISKKFPEMLIMVNITALTKNDVNDEIGKKWEHNAKKQKTNILFGIKNGEVVYKSYKHNKGPADIPKEELLTSESERNTYYHAKKDKDIMKLNYLKMFKGITFSGSVCVDAEGGEIGKYLRKKFSSYSDNTYGPSIQIISSSSVTLPIFKKRFEIDSNQVVTPRIGQGLIIQADGHDKLKRSGVWIVEGEDFKRQKPTHTKTLSKNTVIETYNISANLLHNKLHEEIKDDIDWSEVSPNL